MPGSGVGTISTLKPSGRNFEASSSAILPSRPGGLLESTRMSSERSSAVEVLYVACAPVMEKRAAVTKALSTQERSIITWFFLAVSMNFFLFSIRSGPQLFVRRVLRSWDDDPVGRQICPRNLSLENRSRVPSSPCLAFRTRLNGLTSSRWAWLAAAG